MNSNVKTIIFWVVLVCIAVLLWAVVKQGNHKNDRALNFSEFLTEVEQGNIREVTLNGNEVKGDFMNGQNAFHTIVPSNYPKLFDLLQDKKVATTIADPSSNGCTYESGSDLCG